LNCPIFSKSTTASRDTTAVLTGNETGSESIDETLFARDFLC